ncbi:MAG: arginine--tRNA ligase [Deltaproteobacteria bacterium]|nr:arginine--tRNA ligase [Deltaproteobacteria bacterium]
MQTLSEHLTELIRQAAVAAGYGDNDVPLEPCVPTDPRNGDYQSNYAFRLGKAARSNPRAVAAAMVEALPADPLVASAEVAGPGFINLRLRDEALAAHLLARLDGEGFTLSQPGAGKTMVIDFSSPNIAKRMHVGHLRSTIIGDALRRIYASLGWRVIADNHIGDWGTQFGKLMVAWRRWLDQDAFDADAVGELQRLYQLFGAKAEEDPSLEDLARAETAKLQSGDPENTALWRRFVDASLEEFDAVYDRLGVVFDVTLGESHYQSRLSPLVEGVLAQGLAEEDQGAVIIRFGPEDGKALADTLLLIRKSDGAALYGTTDLATVAYRMETWQPDLIAYVTDVRQRLHFSQVFAAARKMGMAFTPEHVYFGMLRLAGGAIAATRSGAVLNLVDVLDTAVERARGVVDGKSGHLSDQERAGIAEAVGVGAIKYADLSQNPQSDIVFDWDKMLSMEGNTAPYLMYAYARCMSIFRKADRDGFVPGGIALEHPSERSLAVLLARTPEVVERAAELWRPNVVADHLFAVANTFASFYHDCRVIGESPEVEQSRLSLVRATAAVLEQGMKLLGIQPLDRM